MTEPLAYLERLALDLRDEDWKITADRLDAVRKALAEESARLRGLAREFVAAQHDTCHDECAVWLTGKTDDCDCGHMEDEADLYNRARAALREGE